MVKKLNNKGLTAVEILVCFSIVSIVVVSMFKVVNNQRDKQTIASYKNSVTTYKNSVMKTIEDGIIKGEGIKGVVFSEENSSSSEVLKVTLYLNKNPGTGSSMPPYIIIEIFKDNNDSDENNSFYNDYITYSYNNPGGFGDEAEPLEKFPIPKVPNLRLNLIKYSRADEEYFKLYVGLTQPDLGNRYSVIDIVEPINK